MMNNFAVGEAVIVIGYETGLLYNGVIVSLPGKYPKGTYCKTVPALDHHDCYEVRIYGKEYSEPESHLRKLPPDNSQEDIGLTRLKKHIKHWVKENETAKA